MFNSLKFTKRFTTIIQSDLCCDLDSIDIKTNLSKIVEEKYNIKIVVKNKYSSRNRIIYVYYIYDNKDFLLFSLNQYGKIVKNMNIKSNDIKLFLDGIVGIIDRESKHKESEKVEKESEIVDSFSDMLQRKSFWE